MNISEFPEQQANQAGVDPETEALAYAAIGAAIEVHKELGSGLPELTYRNALSIELTSRGIAHECEAKVPVYYKGTLVGEGRIDILVEGKLILELKVVESLNQAHRAQAISYLAAMKLHLALLINFNAPILRDGIKRVIRSK